MSDSTSVRKNYSSLNKEEQFDGYSQVVIVADADDDISYTAGTDTGRTLTLNCPFGTQKMAEDILGKVMGHQYQPYSAEGAHIDPAAEIGDGVTVGNVYSGIFSKNVTHGRLYTADISAPGGEKINYAYQYKSVTERKIERTAREMKATFKVQAGLIAAEVEERKEQGEQFKAQFQVQSNEISAKVSKTGGDNSSFGWDLTDSSWTLVSNGSAVLTATKDGLEVEGVIKATGGTIGGFTINSNYLSYNNQTWGGTNTTGAYLGTSGLQLGKNFKVDMSGNLTAASGTFSGAVYAGSVQYGGSAGTMDGSAISTGSIAGGYGGQISGSTLSTYNFSGGVNTALAYADEAHNYFTGITTFDLIKGRKLNLSKRLYIDGKTLMFSKVTVSTPSGSREMQLATWYDGIVD